MSNVKLEQLEKILNKVEPNGELLNTEQALAAMKEAYNLGITDSSENAETGGYAHNHNIPTDEVDKQSIIKLLIP